MDRRNRLELGLGTRFICYVKVMKDGIILFEDEFVNDVLNAFKGVLHIGLIQENGEIGCARKIKIEDTVAGYSDTQMATLKAGTGDGTVNYFTKVAFFTSSQNCTINKIWLIGAGVGINEGNWAVASPEGISFPVGATLTVEYKGMFTSATGGSYDVTIADYFLFEVARAMGQDVDTGYLACGGLHHGYHKLYYTFGGTPYNDQALASLSNAVSGSDTADYISYYSATLLHAGRDNCTAIKVVYIPSDGVESHALGEALDTTAKLNLDAGEPSTLEMHITE